MALIGAGEFLPAMAEFDAGLLAATGRPRPRVAILPTASAPDGEEVFQRWAAMGVTHFGELGAEVEPVLVRDRFDANDAGAAQAVGEADLIYLSGGKPGHLIRTLEDTAVGRAIDDAHRRGAVLAGCSAGAMVLAGHAFDFRVRADALAAPLATGSRAGAGDVDHAALRRLAGADLRADRVAGAARLGRPGDRRGHGASSVGMARGRSTAGRGSRSGGAAGAIATEPAKPSGSMIAEPSNGSASSRRSTSSTDQPGLTVRKQSEQ